MKYHSHNRFFIIFTCLMSFCCTVTFASNVYENRGVDFTDGIAKPIRFGEIIFQDNFQTLDNWNHSTNNYENRLKLAFDWEYKGKKCFYVDGSGVPPCDTAWSIRSKNLQLPVVSTTESAKEREFTIAIVFSSNQKIKGQESRGIWRSIIEWHDENGAICGESPLLFCSGSGDFQEANFSGMIPASARSYVFQLGFDTPNFDQDHFFALHSVEVGIVNDARPFTKIGTFISEIMPGIDSDFTWEADTPDGTSVRFQIASAPIVHSQPGTFSDFIGPDGTNKTFFDTPFKAKGDFVRYKVFLEPSGKNVPSLKCIKFGEKTDEAWALTRYALPPRVQIVSASPTRNKRETLVIQVTSPILLKWNEMTVTLDGEDVTSRFSREGNRMTLIPETDWADGLHCVNVSIADIHENAVVAKKYFYIGEAPKTEIITMRDDGCILIDGTPFFPIGIYSIMKRDFNGNSLDVAFSSLKEAGFNFGHSYGQPRTDEFIDTALKYGFRLWSVAREPDERFINIERHHPAILAWYLGDDTSDNTTVAELWDRNDAVKALDPTRLTTQADVVSSRSIVSKYQDYVTGTDTFLPEIYPIRGIDEATARNCVAWVICDMKRCHRDIARAKDGTKSIWPIIQYFKGWGWQRFPTYQELRAMSFASLIYGANGITWYTYGGTVEPEKNKFNYGVTATPETWDNMTTVSRQISALSDVLLERTPKEQAKITLLNGPKKDSFENDSISSLLKTHDGAVWLLTVNSTLETIEAEFTLPTGMEVSTCEVLYENRSIEVKNGKFADVFKPLDVHIYKIKGSSQNCCRAENEDFS